MHTHTHTHNDKINVYVSDKLSRIKTVLYLGDAFICLAKHIGSDGVLLHIPIGNQIDVANPEKTFRIFESLIQGEIVHKLIYFVLKRNIRYDIYLFLGSALICRAKPIRSSA